MVNRSSDAKKLKNCFEIAQDSGEARSYLSEEEPQSDPGASRARESEGRDLESEATRLGNPGCQGLESETQGLESGG